MKTYRNRHFFLDDFQSQMEKKIRQNKDNRHFPQRPTGLTEETLSDYLFEHQAALDSAGTERTQLTIAGILIILPADIASGFSDNALPLSGGYRAVAALLLGSVLAVAHRLWTKYRIRQRIHRNDTENPLAKAYIDKVAAFEATD